jgi:streptomycin 6-kinase
MELPEEFVRKVKNVWGTEGAQWAEDFPDLLAECVETWGLHDLSPFSEIYYNMIIGARTENGQAVVLKLGVPNEELSSEVEALQAYDGCGAVRLLDADPVKGALLLERLNPGTELHELHDNRRETEIAAGLMTRLTIPPPEGHRFVNVSDWFRFFDEIETEYDPEAYGLPREMIRTAREFSNELLATMEGEWLLHGDLHHFNILFDEERGWTAIDPKGVIGDKAFQPARFLGNPYPHLLSSADPEADTRERVAIFSEVLELDVRRVLRWGYVDRIVSSCWSIAEDGEKPEFSITCAQIMAKILKNFA